MFPDEPTNAGVFWNGFITAIISFVAGGQPFDGAIVDKGTDFVGDFGGKDKGDVIMKYGDCISPALWKTGQPYSSNRGLNCGEVM